ncbi:MAG: hypothetical protein M3272_03360 [Actinomycetota bacterium]|nr:hypothetical protein [Actinomycetota bacterium]
MRNYAVGSSRVLDIVFGLCLHFPMTKSYEARRRLDGFLGHAFLVLFVLLLLYLFLPFGSQRAVLLGSDVRADEVSRSDTVMILKPVVVCSPRRGIPW